MTRFFPRRPRRWDDRRFLPKDAAAWRRLVDRAQAAAAAPLVFGRGESLARAAQAAAAAVPPLGHGGRNSVFMRLTLEGRLFWTLLDDGRLAKARVLAELAQACADVLDGRAVRPRADLE